MHRNGHFGLNLYLTAPIVFVTGLFGVLEIGLVFVITSAIFPSLPDIDLSLSKYSSIKHRGITHTVWFGLVFGFIYMLVLGSILFYITNPFKVVSFGIFENSQFSVGLLLLSLFFAGFCAVIFHLIGDVFTPTGVNFFSRDNSYGFSINQFYASNEVANRSAIVIGILSLVLAVSVSVNEFIPVYMFPVVYISGLLVWLVFVRTFIGKYTMKLFDFFT